jgi:excisionase family DNA binding protein
VSDDPNLRVSIAEAAQRSGLSRRTIERRVSDGSLHAAKDKEDRRKTLVKLADVMALASGELRSTNAKSSKKGDVLDFESIIDQMLQLLYAHHHRLIHQLYPAAYVPQTLEQVRESPLGRSLQCLARQARGELSESQEQVKARVDEVLAAFFAPSAKDDYWVPRSFWWTDAGKMLASARLTTLDEDSLISIDIAAAMLGSSRTTVNQLMDDGVLDYLYNPVQERVWVLRASVFAAMADMNRPLQPKLADVQRRVADFPWQEVWKDLGQSPPQELVELRRMTSSAAAEASAGDFVMFTELLENLVGLLKQAALPRAERSEDTA